MMTGKPRRAERSYCTFKARRVRHEEITLSKARSSREERPQVQGKRNPSKTAGVARGHQRADRLKP